MCRLLLMNRAAFDKIDSDSYNLEAILHFLMETFGGHGNGVAALFPDGTVRIAKSIRYDAYKTANLLRRYKERGAMWFLFHTRFASCGEIHRRNCHPFQSGKLTLAHNGHDYQYAQLAKTVNRTDSQCITQMITRLQLPLQVLEDVRGVFVGFHHGKPFVVKGQPATDLVAAWDDEAVLLASDLPNWFYDYDFHHYAPIDVLTAKNERDLFQKLFLHLYRPSKRYQRFINSSFTFPQKHLNEKVGAMERELWRDYMERDDATTL